MTNAEKKLVAEDVSFIELKGHTDELNHAVFSPDGKKVVTAGGTDNTVRIWDAVTGKELKKLQGHTGRVSYAAFSPDGKKIVSCSATEDCSVRVWDVDSGQELQMQKQKDGGVSSVAFSPDGKAILVVTHHVARIWDADLKEVLQELGNQGHGVKVAAFSPDGKKVATNSNVEPRNAIRSTHIFQIWDAVSGKELHKSDEHVYRGAYFVHSIDFSPDGKKFITAGAFVQIWDAESGKKLLRLEGMGNKDTSGAASCAAFSPDGKKIVTANRDGVVRLWDAESGKELQKIEGPLYWWVFSVAFSSDGKKVFLSGWPNSAFNRNNVAVCIWDLSAVSKNEVPPPEPATQPISPLDLPPVREEEENLEAFREKILAEERAKELALIEEEQNTVPLVENPDALIALHPEHRLWITPDRKNVVMIGRVILREGFLELLACRVGTKEHESILAVRVEPQLIHAALLAANARQGRPMQMSPVFTPATGDRIDITLRWKDEAGTQHESPAQDWVWDMSASPEDAKKPMATHWVFSGSRMIQDYDGNDRYLANETGELFGLSNFVGSILDVPIRSSKDNTQLMFGCLTERIPPLDTLVTIMLTPVE